MHRGAQLASFSSSFSEPLLHTPLNLIAAQGDEGGLGLPSVEDFVGVCRACMGQDTLFLLAFEPRASAVRTQLLASLRRAFSGCRQVPSEAWRGALSCEHVEMFEMRL